jgi:thiamine-phosphate pyrophosphorylase
VFSTPAIYPILDTAVCERYGITVPALASACLAGGAQLLQLRQKGGGSASFLDLARRIVELAMPSGAAVIVNDRADIAALAGAAGVHVGQDDLSPEEVVGIPGFCGAVGLSTHTTSQVDAAIAGPAGYIAVGPVYDTETKATGYAARGLTLVRYAAGRGKPVAAIGGVTLARVPELRAAGATLLAVISDLLSTGDPERRTRDYVAALST